MSHNGKVITPVTCEWLERWQRHEGVGVTRLIRQADRMLSGSKVETQESMDQQLMQIDLGLRATHGSLGISESGASSWEKHQVN